MSEVTLPRLVGSRNAARTLLSSLESSLVDASVVLDCRRLRSAPPSFADELVKILFDEHKLSALVLKDASEEFVRYVRASLDARDIPRERLTVA